MSLRVKHSGLLVFPLIVVASLPAVERLPVEATINGKTVQLAYDTGSAFSVTLWPKAAQDLGLKVNPPAANDKAQPGQILVGTTEPATFVLRGQTLYDQRFAVPQVDGLSVMPDLQGVVGWPAFRGETLTFHPTTRNLTIGDDIPRSTTDWTKFWLRSDYSTLAVEIPNTSGGHPSIILIDTGSSAGVMLASSKWHRWKEAHAKQPLTLRDNHTFGAGETVTEESWAGKLTINGLVLHNVPVSESDDTTEGPEYVATLGLAALWRMELVIDPTINRVYARPLTSAPVEYQHNRLGAVFVPANLQNDDLVAHVVPGSPAALAGIHDGDILLKIDETDATKWRSRPDERINETFFQRAGTKIVLQLRRGQGTLTIYAVLQDILGPDPHAN